MSVLTSFLKLFKYQASDDASTFNIDVSLNDNWDKIDEAVSELDTGKADTNHTHTAADVGADPAGTGAAAAQQVQGNLQTHQADETRHVSTASKATPVDADSIALVDSADGNKVKRVLWIKVKSLFAAATHSHSASDVTSGIFSLSRGGLNANTAAGGRATLDVYSKAEVAAAIAAAAPSVTGVYVGDKAVVRDITLGFQPSYVVIIMVDQNNEWYTSSYVPGGSVAILVRGAVYKYNSNVKVEITATGFKITDTYTADTTWSFNDSNSSYRYVAFK